MRHGRRVEVGARVLDRHPVVRGEGSLGVLTEEDLLDLPAGQPSMNPARSAEDTPRST